MSDFEHNDSNNRLIATTIGDSGQPNVTILNGSKIEFHLALVVSNVRNHIPTILEMEKINMEPGSSFFYFRPRQTWQQLKIRGKLKP